MLITLTLIAPIAAAGLGLMSAGQIGASLGKTAPPLLMLVAIAAGLTRKRGPLGKGIARIAVGILIVGIGASNVLPSIADEKNDKKYAEAALQFKTRRAASFRDLGVRLEQVGINEILTLTSMTTKIGQDAARAKLAQYATLIAERNETLSATMSEGERLISDWRRNARKQLLWMGSIKRVQRPEGYLQT